MSAVIDEARERIREIGRNERAKASVREVERDERPVDDGKARPHVSCNVAKVRTWWRVTWRGKSWPVLFTDRVGIEEVGAWAFRMAYDGAELEPLDDPPAGHGKAWR